jgi:hypothetical protein
MKINDGCGEADAVESLIEFIESSQLVISNSTLHFFTFTVLDDLYFRVSVLGLMNSIFFCCLQIAAR